MRRVATPSLPLEPIGDDKQLLADDSASLDDEPSLLSASHQSTTGSFLWRLFRCRFSRNQETSAPRTVELPSGRCLPRVTHPRNVVRNAKYSLTSFFPLVMIQQFRFFFNLYFLLIALSQFVPALQIGALMMMLLSASFVQCISLQQHRFSLYIRLSAGLCSLGDLMQGSMGRHQATHARCRGEW